ncbi:MAG TPA: DsbA family protein [Acidimicrobiales bacterium]|nr:DsbA family protein [Acidimicrobiales bacterium]
MSEHSKSQISPADNTVRTGTTYEFAVTWDYRCPFARNANEHLVRALQGGAPWKVTFVPFSLSQSHVEEGDPDVWDSFSEEGGLLANEFGLAVMRVDPDKFLDAHLALFAARHDESMDLRDSDVLARCVESVGVDPQAVLAEIANGEIRDIFRKSHELSVSQFDVFGVPTFIVGYNEWDLPSFGSSGAAPACTTDAVFARLMTRPDDGHQNSRETIEQVLALLVGSPELNEFKHTKIPF